MAPIEQYLEQSLADEVVLARSAAPASISDQAEVLAFGKRGYESVAKGTNGFVCFVERSWANSFDSPEFWNPRVRSPNCYNAAAARSVLPPYLKRTEWVLAGASPAQMQQRTQAAIAANEIPLPEPGAMCFMMSKISYLGDEAGGHWHPHLMFFQPQTESSAWGADVHGSPVIKLPPSGIDRVTVFMALVPRWSDGTPAPLTM
jgi:hypothetical protein